MPKDNKPEKAENSSNINIPQPKIPLSYEDSLIEGCHLINFYQRQINNATGAIQIVMDLDPKNANIANSYGAFLCQNGDYEKAKTYFLKAVNTSSYVSSAETYENLAMCSHNQGRPEDTIQYLRSAVNHQPGRVSSLYLLAQSLVETQQWLEAREILRRYEKVSQISPQSLLLAMKIESGTGNDTAAKGYLDMLLKIFPNDAITKSAYAEHKQSLELVKKAENLAMLIEKPKVVPAVVESQTTQLPSDNAGVEVEKNDLLVGVKEVNNVVEEAPKDTGAVADSEQKQFLELEEKTESSTVLIEDAKALPEVVESQEPQFSADKTLIEAEKNESVVREKEATIGLDEIPQDTVTVVEKMSEQVTEVELENLENPEFHVVAKGENLYRISLLYNIKMQRLIDWNGLVNDSAIYEGKKLSLVAPSVVE